MAPLNARTKIEKKKTNQEKAGVIPAESKKLQTYAEAETTRRKNISSRSPRPGRGDTKNEKGSVCRRRGIEVPRVKPARCASQTKAKLEESRGTSRRGEPRDFGTMGPGKRPKVSE